MYFRRFYSCVSLFCASLPMLCSASDRIVNTRLLQETQLEENKSISIDLKYYFQIFSENEPTATFEISLPETVGKRWMYTASSGVIDNGRFLADKTTEPEYLQAYEIKDSSNVNQSYDSPLSIFPGDLEWENHVFKFRLMSESAPLTVANFMTYAADGEYNKSQIHWANNTDFKILQTGKYRVNSDLSPVWLENVPTYSPVPLEAGVALTKGTIALARSANDLNSGANQFFFNLSDNSGLANSNGSWTEQYSVFATLLEGDLSRLNTVIEAIKLSFNSPTFDNYVPEGFTANYPSPAITSYWDVSPANWFYFNKVSISSGQTDGLQYEWHFLEGGNSDSFVVSLYNSILRIESVDTGEATLIVEASKEGFSPVTTAIKLTSAPNGVAWLFHDGTISNNGWLGSWYGWMTMNSFPYVSHLDHAFQYIPPSSTDSSFFVYDMEYGESPEKDSLGWFYTNENLYPWVYLYSQSIWLRHLQGTSKFAGPRWFYNSSGDWVTDYQLLNP